MSERTADPREPATARPWIRADGQAKATGQARYTADLPFPGLAHARLLLAGRSHATTLASTRPTMELVTALYASVIEGETIRRSDLTRDCGFYHRLDGGLPAELVSSRLRLA